MLTQLDKPIEEIAAYAPQALHTLSSEIANTKALTKKREDALNAALDRIYGTAITNAYAQAKKDTGVARIPASNTLNLKVDRDKDVKWDQAALRKFRDSGCPHIKEEFSVAEPIYKALPEAQQKVLAAARTIKVGRNKFSFEEIKLGE